MPSHADQIQQRFPTERYKRFWYPTRPMFTLLSGLSIAALGFLGIVPLSWALWFAAAFALDDLPLTPITGMFTAINNLLQGRKKLKAVVMITALSLALILGGVLGYFFIAQTPFAVKLITDYIALTSCSPLLISLGAILGAYVAHATHKISPFMGFALGICVASFIPFSPPLIVEIVFLSMAACTFVTSVITKQALRAYYKHVHGETNADGYEHARSTEAQAEFINQQAEKFNVTPEELQALATHCKVRVAEIKRNASFYQEYIGSRNYTSNSFKDIYHSLMNPKLTPAEVVDVKDLIANSKLPAELENDAEARATQTVMMNVHFVYGTFFHQGVEARTLGHQLKIAEGGGLNEELIRPFAM